MGVQKHLFVIERNIIKELLKLKTNACSFTKLFFIANYVKRSRAPHYPMFGGVFLLRGQSLTVVNYG